MSGLTKPCGSGGARAGVHTSQSLRLQSKWGLQFQVLSGCQFNLFFVRIWPVELQVTSFSCCQFNLWFYFSIWDILSSSSSSCRLFLHPFLARAATGDLFRFFINRKWSFQKVYHNKTPNEPFGSATFGRINSDFAWEEEIRVDMNVYISLSTKSSCDSSSFFRFKYHLSSPSFAWQEQDCQGSHRPLKVDYLPTNPSFPCDQENQQRQRHLRHHGQSHGHQHRHHDHCQAHTHIRNFLPNCHWHRNCHRQSTWASTHTSCFLPT